MKRLKKDGYLSTDKWEELKKYAAKNDVPIPIESIAERKIIKGQSSTDFIKYYYSSKFFELEASIGSYVHRRRTIYLSVATAVATFLLPRLWNCLLLMFCR